MNIKFHPLMQLSGGIDKPYFNKGKGGDMPDTPDYEQLAKQQAKQQLALSRSTTKANRINQYTPWGSIEYTQGDGSQQVFDQAGYDRAMQAYQSQAAGATSSQPHNLFNNARSSLYNPSATNNAYASSRGGALAPPDRAQFYTGGANDPDKWSSTVTLNPELQKILDNEFSTKQQGYSELQSYLSNIKDDSLIPRAPINAGQTAQEAIMARLNPTFNTDEESLRTRLMNQGVRAGSEAWDNEFRNFERRKNDAFSQAALQGIGLDNEARARALAEQGMPLNAIQSFLSGGQVQSPNFTGPGQQGQTAAPDLMGAAQAGYGANMNAYNANQAASSNMMGGLFSLGAGILGAPATGGGSLAAALFGL